MRKVVGVVVVIVVLVGLKFYNKGSDDKAVLADMKALIAQVASSADETTYLNGILEREHSKAFDAAYDMGGRRRSAKLDEDKYIDAIFKAMISQCENDKKKELAEKLRTAHQELREADK
jgi:hypothetical protein